MYKLIAYNGSTWQELDLGKDKPAMNYQVNDVAELQDRQLDYSQSLALPMSPTNVKFFQFINTPGSTSTRPYTKHECRLFASEHVLAGKAARLILLSVTDTFNVQITAGTRDLAELLETTLMSATDLGYFYRYYTSLDPANFDTAHGMEFAFASFTKEGISRMETTARSKLPFYRDEAIMTAILAHHSYTWVHNLDETYEPWNRYAIPVVDLIPSAGSFANLSAYATYIKTGENVTYAAAHALPFDLINIGYNEELTTVSILVAGMPDDNALYYTAKLNCTVRVHYTQVVTDATVFGDAIIAKLIFLSNGVYTDIMDIVTYHETDFAVDETYDVVLKEGDILIVQTVLFPWNAFGVVPVIDFNINASFLMIAADYVPYGGKVWPAGNLGYEYQADYVKTFLQKFGLTLFVDHANSIVYTYTMKEVYDNIPSAVDWSDKLHSSNKKQQSFILKGYAQTNKILLKDNSDDNVKSSGSFVVANDNLEITKDLFTLDLEAVKDYETADTIHANIPVFKYDDVLDTYAFSPGKPSQVILSEATIEVYAGALPVNYHIAVSRTAQDFINAFYNDLTTKMLVSAKIVEEVFWLEPKDVENFNHFIPVYLKQYGKYFYVNKVIDFVENQLTTVELIKL